IGDGTSGNNNIKPTPVRVTGSGPAPDLVLTKSVVPAVAQPGQPITYTLAFSNTGSEIAAAVVLTDLLPPALTDLSYTSSLPVTPTGGTNYTWQLPDLAPGTSGLITVTARLSPTLTTEATITNSATIATTAIEITTNNTASVALAV